MRRPPKRASILLAGGLLLTLTSCGGDDDDATPASAAGPADSSLTVLARDIDFDADGYEAEAGAVEFVYENEGNIVHTLVIEGVPIELTVRKNGDVDRGVVDLTPGEYTIFCDVPGHRAAGMAATLTVT